MAIYREGYYAIEEIGKRSKRIYPDAADYGALVIKGDALWNLTKQLSEMYGDPATRKEAKYSTGATVSIMVTLIDEWAVSDERKTVEEATDKFKVTFVMVKDKIHKVYDGYVYVEQES